MIVVGHGILIWIVCILGLMALRDMSGLRLWIALSFLSLVHLAQAADTSTAGPEISYLCTAWSILIMIISAFGLAVFGGVLLYYLDILSYHVFFSDWGVRHAPGRDC